MERDDYNKFYTNRYKQLAEGTDVLHFPSVEAGKIFEYDGKLLMPFSMTYYHVATDGYHVNIFLEGLQEDMNSFEKTV